MSSIITLLTDFGLKDAYTGVMKGVILSVNPEAQLVDITHDVGPQNIEEAAYLVDEYYRYFPTGTTHLCVVDPTVGSSRRPIIICRDGYYFVGPDNGIFTHVLKGARTFAITNSAYMLKNVSDTFHGRDIFAPVAAHISNGVRPEEIGVDVSDPVNIKDNLPVIQGTRLVGKVVRFDHFGNAITNIRFDLLERFTKGRSFQIQVGDRTFRGINRSYSENEVTCIPGSSGYVEFGWFSGSFQEKGKAYSGQTVTVTVD